MSSPIPRIGDILEDGDGNRDLVVNEGRARVDARYALLTDDPTRCGFRDESVRIVGNIVDWPALGEVPPADGTPRPTDVYDRIIASQRRWPRPGMYWTWFDPGGSPVLVVVFTDADGYRCGAASNWFRALRLDELETVPQRWEVAQSFVPGAAERATREQAAARDAGILLGLRAAAILTADHDCGEEHDDAMEALQAKIAALSADGARSMVEADERQREETRKVREQAGWPADPVDRGYPTFYFSEIAKWPDTPPVAPTLHTIVALPNGLTLAVPHDAAYRAAKVGDVLRRIYRGTVPVVSIVKTADGARVEKETAPPLHPGQYVATKEGFDAARRADTYTETHTVGGLSSKAAHAPKIQVGQVWQERDGRMAAVTRLPPTTREGPLFQFNVATAEIAASGTFSPGYGVVFDCEHDLVNTNGCTLVAGPGSPWSEP